MLNNAKKKKKLIVPDEFFELMEFIKTGLNFFCKFTMY